jgi:hypothetical protein
MKQRLERLPLWFRWGNRSSSRDLSLATFTHDVAVWGALAQIILLIEQHIGQYGHGSQKHYDKRRQAAPSCYRFQGMITSLHSLT